MTVGDQRRPFIARTLQAVQLDAWPSEFRQHVSAQQLKMFARCPEQYRRRYVKGEKERPNGAIVWGLADHDAHENNFVQKIVTGVDLTTSDVQTVFAAKLDERVEKDGGPTEVEWKRGERFTGDDAKKAHADVKDAGTRLVGYYHETVSPSILPTAAELEFLIAPERFGLPVPIKGRIDLKAIVPVSPGSKQGVTRIIERKTANQRKKPSPEYILAARVYQLEEPLEVDIQFSIKTKTPGVAAFEHILPVQPEPMVVAQVKRLMVGMASLYTMYGPDEPWPGAFGGFSDTCSYCGFQPTCPWWQSDHWDSRLIA